MRFKTSFLYRIAHKNTIFCSFQNVVLHEPISSFRMSLVIGADPGLLRTFKLCGCRLRFLGSPFDCTKEPTIYCLHRLCDYRMRCAPLVYCADLLLRNSSASRTRRCFAPVGSIVIPFSGEWRPLYPRLCVS